MTRILPVAGALAVGYAVAAVLSIVVWDPMAAVPSLTYTQILAGIDQAGESWIAGVIVPLVLFLPGVVVAAALAVLAIAGHVRWPTAVAGQLALLVGGALVHFAARFPLDMAVADAFLVSGGAHQPVPFVLYGVSALAAVALAVGAVVMAPWRAAPAAARE